MKKGILAKFGIFVFLFYLISCSIQRQSPISRKLFVKQDVQIKDKTVFDTLTQTIKEESLFLPNETVKNVEEVSISEVFISKVDKKTSLIIKSKRFTQKLTSLFSKLNLFPKSKNIGDRNFSKGEKNTDKGISKGIIYSKVGFSLSFFGTILAILALVLIILLFPIATFIILLVAIIILILGFIFSLFARISLKKNKNNESKEENGKWKKFYRLATSGIILSFIILGIIITIGIAAFFIKNGF